MYLYPSRVTVFVLNSLSKVDVIEEKSNKADPGEENRKYSKQILQEVNISKLSWPGIRDITNCFKKYKVNPKTRLYPKIR